MASPADTAKALEGALEQRAANVELFDAYYRGAQRIAFATSKWRDTYGSLFDELADNWCQLVVDAAVERLKVEGFRFGPPGDDADDAAWQLWQANYLDADQSLAYTEACKSGLAYLLVLPGDEPETPRITVESPLQVITYNAPDDRRRRLSGLKRWVDDDGTQRAVLYTPDRFYRFARDRNRKTWQSDGAPVDNVVAPVVPVVPMLNNPTIMGHGISDLNVVVPLQDAVNKLLADLLVNSEYVAYPQRYATGLEIPIDPETGRPLDRERWLSSVSRMWVAEDENVKFGQLPEADGAGYVRLVEAIIQHIAAQTRTPPHYLLGSSGNFPSGESLKATETGLVAKVKRKQTTFGEAWEEGMRLAFAYRSDPRSTATDAEVIWADPESRSLGELTDSLVKMVSSVGLPMEAAWAIYGASPQEIARWRVLRGLPERPAPDDTTAPATAQGAGNAPPANGNQPTPTPGVGRDG